jgi:Cu2+-exporting ATPase
MVTVMVITCPHALGLAVPLVVAVSTALAAGRGLLIRDRNGFERARRLDGVVFDKTGTLTEGRFAVSDVVPLGNRDEEVLLKLAAAVESQSEHPIAQGITGEAQQRGLNWEKASDFGAIAGKGAQARVRGNLVKVVSPGYLKEQDMETDGDRVRELAEQGKTVVYVLIDDEVAGAIALGDVVRDESREAIDRLKQMGVRVMMITGDSQTVARAVAEELRLDDYFAEVLPNDKAKEIRKLRERGLAVAMVGDGINDAPALAEADVGIAIGAGTDVAMETADIVLVNSDPRDVLNMVSLSRSTYRKMVQNLWWASGYNILAIPLAAGVAAPLGIILPPAVGALVMSVSTVIVAVNSRLLRMPRDASDKAATRSAAGTSGRKSAESTRPQERAESPEHASTPR